MLEHGLLLDFKDHDGSFISTILDQRMLILLVILLVLSILYIFIIQGNAVSNALDSPTEDDSVAFTKFFGMVNELAALGVLTYAMISTVQGFLDIESSLISLNKFVQNAKQDQSARSSAKVSGKGGGDGSSSLDAMIRFISRARLVHEDDVKYHVGITALQRRMLLAQGVPHDQGKEKSAEKGLVVDFGTLGCDPARFTIEALNTNNQTVADSLGKKAAVGEGHCWRTCLAGECCQEAVNIKWGNDLAKSYFKEDADAERMGLFYKRARKYRNGYSLVLLAYTLVFGGIAVAVRLAAGEQPPPPPSFPTAAAPPFG